MSSLLEVEEIRAAVQPLSVAFYHELQRLGMVEKDVEFLEGLLVKKMSKSPLHETMIRRCLRALQAQLSDEFFLTKESPLTTLDSEPEPDVAVIRGHEEDFTHRHPNTAELVIEVAISTLERDRNKADIYARAGVKEYWLINPADASITLHTIPKETGYAVRHTWQGEVTVESTVFPAFQLRLPELFA
jgi:Uma2 family endonuclease